MKKIITTLLTIAVMTSCSISLKAQEAIPATVIGGLFVKDAINQLGIKINSAIDNAGAQGNFVLENAAMKANLLMQNANYMLNKQREGLVKDLSLENMKLISTLNQAVGALDKLPETILDLENFLAIDIQNYINQIPFKKDVFLLRKISGFSQIYQSNGYYNLSITGTAFAVGYSYKVKINGTEISPDNFYNMPPYTLDIHIPISIINSLFKDDSIVRCPISVECYGVNRPSKLKFWKKPSEVKVFSYESKFLLLPKFPAKYELTEYYQTTEFSDEIYWSELGKGEIPSTGEEFKHKTGCVTASIPEGCLMLKDQIEKDAKPGTHFAWYGGLQFAGQSVTACGDHYIHDQPTFLFLKVAYKKPVTTVKNKPGILQNSQRQPINDGKLMFGTYTARLDKDYESFDLRITFFNGQEVLITPYELAKSGIKVIPEMSTYFKRIVVSVTPPKN